MTKGVNSPIPTNKRQNHLLAVLPEAERKRLFPHLEPITMPLGRALYESGDRLEHVYFPTTAIVSLLYIMENGASAEIAIVGNEGVVGIALFMGGETMPKMLKELEGISSELNISRQVVIKSLLRQALDQHYLAKSKAS